jgi:hypothetical protein
MSGSSRDTLLAPAMAALLHDWRTSLQSIQVNAEIIGLAGLSDDHLQALVRIQRTVESALQRLGPVSEQLKTLTASTPGEAAWASLAQAMANAQGRGAVGKGKGGQTPGVADDEASLG